MKKLMLLAVLAVGLGAACDWNSPAAPEANKPTPNLTDVTVISMSPAVGSDIRKGDEVSITVTGSYDVTALMQQNIQPRLFGHRAGDPATMFVGGMLFPQRDSYMEIPPKGNLTLTFDGDIGGRALYDAEPGSIVDYVVLSFMYRAPDGRLEFVSFSDGRSDADSRPINLDWHVR